MNKYWNAQRIHNARMNWEFMQEDRMEIQPGDWLVCASDVIVRAVCKTKGQGENRGPNPNKETELAVTDGQTLDTPLTLIYMQAYKFAFQS